VGGLWKREMVIRYATLVRGKKTSRLRLVGGFKLCRKGEGKWFKLKSS